MPGRPLPGPPLGFPTGPEDLLVEADGTPRRIDKAFSWEAPLAAHGMLHLVITNAHNGDPYPIDTLFMYMTNMAWNSAMNTAGTIAMLTAKDPASGDYRIPRIIYSDAYFSEMVAYADLILPDTTYLERWDCISLLDRPISSPDGPADSIRQPVLPPDRDVRPFQDVLLDLGARLALPGMVNRDGSAKFPNGYADYLVHHERRPGIGPLAGWRGADGSGTGRGEPNPDQLQRYIEHGCFWQDELAPDARFYKHANRAYLEYARAHGLHRAGRADHVAAVQRGAAEVPPGRAGPRRGAAAGAPSRACAHLLRSAAVLVSRVRAGRRRGGFPVARHHPAAGGHVSLLGLDEPLAAPDPQLQPAVPASDASRAARARGRRLGLGDQPAWPRSRRRCGSWTGSIRTPAGPGTRSASGPAPGIWRRTRPRRRKRFLLNHLIDELLPEREGGYRYANADPVTGQAAWYDLRVRVERAPPAEAGLSAPQFPAAAPAGQPAGAAGDLQVRPGVPGTAMTSLPATRPARRLGLVIDLDTCVGCQACVVSCKEWNTGGHPAPLTDQDPYGAEPRGAWLNRVHGYEVGEGEDGRTVHFPKSCLHCEDAACVTVCPTGASYKRAEDGIVLVDEELCIGCGLCAWACPYGARELDADQGVMKKCTLCIDRIYNANLAEEDRDAGVRAGVPHGRAPLRRPRRSGLGGLAPGRRARRLRPDAGARLRADQQVPAAAAAPDRSRAALAPRGSSSRAELAGGFLALARSRARRL